MVVVQSRLVRVILKAVLAFAIVYAGVIGLLFVYQRSLLYFPPPVSHAPVVPDYQPVRVVTKDGVSLQGYLNPPDASNKPIILVFHGNGSLAVWMTPSFKPLVEDGYGVLLAEYRGYGGNSGEPTEQGLYADADAYLQFLRIDEHLKSHPIIVYGQSLGSGVAVDLAARNADHVAGLVLEVPFASVVDVVGRVYPFVPLPEILVKDSFLSRDKISAVDIPKLFLLAGHDEVVGFEGGKKLYDLAPHPKTVKIYPDATHMTVYNAGAGDDVRVFLEREIGQ